MRYLKTYEAIDPTDEVRKGVYWKIPGGLGYNELDSNIKFNLALKKINAPLGVIPRNIINNLKKIDYIYVGYIMWVGDYFFNWTVNNEDFFVKHNVKFEGEIIVEDYEIKAEKYNL